MKIPSFDYGFIRDWESRYYSCSKGQEDEKDYQHLLSEVAKECRYTGTISKQTLEQIMKWKYRPGGTIRYLKGDYETVYASRFRIIVSKRIKEHLYLLLLLWSAEDLNRKSPIPAGILNNIQGKAHGFDLPMASTVAHFIYPGRFPIIDIRTAEMLYLFDKITSPNSNSYSIYEEQFRKAILNRASETGCSVHSIDRALFSFHENELQSEIDKKLKALGHDIGYTEEAIGKHLPLRYRKLRQMIIDIIKWETKEQKH